MTELENPAESTCFGCGPANSRGLRLRMQLAVGADGGEEVRCRFVPRDDEIGWTGLLHGGLHYLILQEASYWAAWTLGGRVMRFEGPATYSQVRLPRVGKEYVARARLTGRTERGVRVHAASESLEGAPCGALDSTWVRASRAEVARARLDLPSYLLEEMDP